MNADDAENSKLLDRSRDEIRGTLGRRGDGTGGVDAPERKSVGVAPAPIHVAIALVWLAGVAAHQ